MKKREVYETNDGAIFKTKEEAVAHQIETAIIDYGESHALDMSNIDAVLKWMVMHPSVVTHMLKQLL